MTLAEGNAAAFRITRVAQAQALQKRIEAENDAMGSIKSNIKGITPQQLVAYQQYLTYSSGLKNATVLYGLGSGATPLINIGAGGGSGSTSSGGGSATRQ